MSDRPTILFKWAEVSRRLEELEEEKLKLIRKKKRLEESNPWLGNVKGIVRGPARKVASEDVAPVPGSKRPSGEAMETGAPSPKKKSVEFSEEERKRYRHFSSERNRLLQMSKGEKNVPLKDLEKLIKEAAFFKKPLRKQEEDLLSASAGIEQSHLVSWYLKYSE